MLGFVSSELAKRLARKSVSKRTYSYSHLVTHLVWPHARRSHLHEAYGLSRPCRIHTKPILVFLILSSLPLKQLMLPTSIQCGVGRITVKSVNCGHLFDWRRCPWSVFGVILYVACVCVCVGLLASLSDINEDRLCYDESLIRDDWLWTGMVATATDFIMRILIIFLTCITYVSHLSVSK